MPAATASASALARAPTARPTELAAAGPTGATAAGLTEHAPRVVELERWFFAPVPPSARLRPEATDAEAVARGPVRVWGYHNSGDRLWRSSSIVHVAHRRTLVTRYGTTVMLRGPLDAVAAAAAAVPQRVIQLFKDGFPASWRDALSKLPGALPPPIMPRTANPKKAKSRAPSMPARRPLNPPVPRQRRPSKNAAEALPNDSVHRTRSRDLAAPRNPSTQKRLTKSLSMKRAAAVDDSRTREPRTRLSSKRKQKSARGNPPEPGNGSSRATPHDNAPSRPTKKRRKQVGFAPYPTTYCDRDEEPPPSSSPCRASDPVSSHAPSPKPNGTNSISEARELQSTPRTTSAREVAKFDAKLPETPISHRWTSEQLAAYENQRRLIPPDAPDYWKKVAAGVDGKSAAECLALWDSKWTSPAVAATRQGTRRPPAASTPEIVSQVVSAAPGARKTLKYKSNLRKVAAVINREADDEVFEPVLGNADDQAPFVSNLPLTATSLPIVGELRRGTPDTASKVRRAEAERRGTVQTPEILARGRSFGLAEADQYLAVFHRRRARQAADASKGRAPRTVLHWNSPGDAQASSTAPFNAPINNIYGPEAAAEANDKDDNASTDSDHFEYIF